MGAMPGCSCAIRVVGWLDHNASRTRCRAGVLYRLLGAWPPSILLLSIAIAGALFRGAGPARGQIFGADPQISSDLRAPRPWSRIIQNASSSSGSGALTTVFSVLTVIIGATTALVELKAGLDEIWDVPPEQRQGFWYFIRTRLLSVGVILALAFLLYWSRS